MTLRIESPEFSHLDEMPDRFTCRGGGHSPTLEISDVPAEAKSLALIVDDPDAPRGVFVHWVVFNMDPTTTDIDEDAVPPDAEQGATSVGRAGYAPPCPPSGTHRYFFRLYALDELLDLPGLVMVDQLIKEIREHVVEETDLVGLVSARH